MYTTDQTQNLHSITGRWLNINAPVENKDVEELRNILRFHEHRYYVLNDPLISDAEYDKLYKLLEKFEKENPACITKNSPTQRVGAGLIKDFPKVQHLVPMLSLENSYNAEDLYDWDRKARELSGLEVIEYCAEPKFDGASISIIYEDDYLVRGATRGDGETGDDITPNIKLVKTLPLFAAFSTYGIEQVEIRGEVMMNKKNFKAFNEKLMEEGVPPLANPRNAAAGTLRIKDTTVVSKRKLEAFLYHVSYLAPTRPEGSRKTTGYYSGIPLSHSGMLEMLWDLGFKSPKNEMKVLKGVDAVIEHIQDYEKLRDDLPYEIDGMVIKVNDLQLQDRLGMTSHHPRWAIAYKFKARQATSKLLAVDYQVGRTGAVTPVAKIAPVKVGGVTVTSISIHNEEYIREKDLQLGDTILIERSGDVIPQIVKSQHEFRTGTEKKIVFPKQCPVCKEELYKPEGEAVWRCININCEAQVVERIIHFVSKDAMDIRSFGEANVRKFYEMGLLHNIPGIYKMNFEKLQGLPGFGDKSITNLKQAIEDSKKQPLHRLIYGLGIRYVGETTAKTLAQAVGNIFNLARFTEEQLLQLDDVGVKVAKSIHEFFANEENIHILEQLRDLGISIETTKNASVSGSLAGQSFLFTGTLLKLKRSEAEEMVEKAGGKVLSGVSTKLNYLVVGEDAGSKLEKAKRISAIHIISEDEFLNMIAT